MNCFEKRKKLKYEILQDDYVVGEIVIEIEPLEKYVKLLYSQYTNGILVNSYQLDMDRNNKYSLKPSENIINIDFIYDNIQALFFLPLIGDDGCVLNIYQQEEKEIFPIIYNIIKNEYGYIVKTVFPIQSFAEYNMDYSLKYFKNSNITIVNISEL